MIAMLGSNLVQSGVEPSGLDFSIDPSMPMNRIVMR